jgi:hypothetical protein
MNYEKDFSFVFPTRNNIPGLLTFIKSCIDTADNKTKLEFCIVPDIDDPQLPEIKEAVKGYPVRVYETHPTDNFNRDYFNWVTWKTVGRNVWCINDDAVMLTQGWDTIINEKTKGKSLYLIDTWDSTHEHEGISFPRFPLVSRDAIDTVGFLMFPQVRTYPADRVLYDFYNMLGIVIDCTEVKIQHNHIDSGDPSKSKMYRIFREDCANKVFPVNCYVEHYKMKSKLAKENTNGNQNVQVL